MALYLYAPGKYTANYNVSLFKIYKWPDSSTPSFTMIDFMINIEKLMDLSGNCSSYFTELVTQKKKREN